MNKKFLDRVAEDILQRHPSDLSEVIIVLPAKRAKLFIREYLSKRMGKAFWLPRFLIMPEFVEYLSQRRISSEIDLLIFLYECHLKISSRPEDFVAFIKWAGLALKDFNDIDSSLVDPDKIFSDLRDIREIDGWSFNSKTLSAGQIEYMKFWSELSDLHNEFIAQSEAKNIWTYQSLLKSVLFHFAKVKEDLKGNSVYFVGIASYSPAELKLFQEIQNSNVCDAYWDFDRLYVENPMHEAGFFARQLLSKSIKLNWIGDHFSTVEKEITFYQCTTSISQAFSVAELLQKMSAEELNNTCVVLPDLSGLDALLSILSDIKVPVNIAAGIPLTESLPVKWTLFFLRLKLSQETKSQGIYFQDLIEWFQLLIEMKHHDEESRELIREIRKEKRVFYDQLSLNELMRRYAGVTSLLKLLNRDVVTTDVLSELIVSINFEESEIDFVAVAGLKLKEVLRQLIDLSERHSYLNNWNALKDLFELTASRDRIFYDGQPIQGLQVLSMVETRALDFQHVFVLDANEDSLPGSSHEQSFIPFDLRHHHHLPMPDEKDAMYAYTFYRLLHFAQKVHLLYSTVSGDFKGTEQSRYLTQIENEFPKFNSKLFIHKKSLSLSADFALRQSVVNSDFARKRLDQILAHGISPSAINKFNQCPLDFYYRYIIGLGEEVVHEEQMSIATFGTVIHHVLEKFYSQYVDSFPTNADYKSLEESMDFYLDESISANYSSHGTDTGFNLLARSVAKTMLIRIIRYEEELLIARNKEQLQMTLLKVEFSLIRSVEHEKYGWDRPVVMKGKGDRLDRISGIDYILDYKTGSVKDEDTELKPEIEILFKHNKSAKQLQLLAYIYMYAGEGHAAENIRAGFYSFTNHDSGYKFLEGKKEQVTNETLERFESAFMDWVKAVYSLEKFEHTKGCDYCQFCN